MHALTCLSTEWTNYMDSGGVDLVGPVIVLLRRARCLSVASNQDTFL
jgi:hypothetical protein